MEPPAQAELRTDVDQAVATLTLSRPEQGNPQTPRLWAALAAAADALPPEVHVVVVRAEGPSFSAGQGDSAYATGSRWAEGAPTGLGELVRRSDEEVRQALAGYQEAFSWCRRTDLLTIAAVQGHAVDAGFALALACDLRVCAEDARFAMRETSLGLVPGLGGIQPLVAAVGYARALEICVTGRWVDADEARHLGLAAIVVPRADLDATVGDLCAAVTAADAGAVAAVKKLMLAAPTRTYDEQLAAERDALLGRLRAGQGSLPHGSDGSASPKATDDS